jgi:hypothetical protein
MGNFGLGSARMNKRLFLFIAITSTAGVLGAAYLSGQDKAAAATLSGVVAGSYFTPPEGQTASKTIASYYGVTKVCVDLDNNGACGPGEMNSMTNAKGVFVLSRAPVGPITAEISTASTNAGQPVKRRLVFRASKEQVAADIAAGRPIAVTPVSTELVRMMEADNLDFATAQRNLAQRLNVSADQVLKDPNAITPGAALTSLLRESVILTERFTLAATMVDRHDAGLQTMKQADQAAMNLEGIPRYDNLFIIMLENKATSSIKNSRFAPKINAYLNAGNQLTSYYSTGNPSEPNYTALAAADDFGITDDANWNCVPEGDKADLPEDPLPAGMSPCTNPTNHNIKNRANLFTALSSSGMTWRVYSESMNPGRDWRLRGIADPKLIAPDNVYPASSPLGAIGNSHLMLPLPDALYATKHNPTLAFQNVRSSADFKGANRTMGGGQWDEAIKRSPAAPQGWDIDQLGTDLRNGDIANLNFLVPDQCDDMHGVKLTGTIEASGEGAAPSDCSGNAIIYRGDNYVDYLIRKIQDSMVWQNAQKRVAIIIMFDEGTATSGFNSCCGWNPIAGVNAGSGKETRDIAGRSQGILTRKGDGTGVVDTTVARYGLGNKGHGNSVFGILTNQPRAPKRIVDSDAYSHFSLVRTLQDMFQLADPGDDWSYMNRSKYTEKFIAAHLQFLPEFAGSADPHFDAVRPMNHAYVIPADYVQKNGFPSQQVGPDANQINVWALK